jgi:type III secretion protein V
MRQAFASALRLPGGMRAADIALIGVVAAVMIMMILPLPPLALDMLIAINISAGILLLLSTLYIAKPLDFSTFPTVLLITTLFRLAISIATTRMILTEMHAGDIVKQFGKVVAGNNIVAGLVIFLIITIVQFIVIAKGAERVAEVAARFSLDAMPGKQLSIDSDLRSGLLSKDEAKAKRRMLEQESKMHGSLDGAMKFVKGDAIASIIIVIVNLLGGITIGILYHDLPIAEAASIFSILTIGDGLVAQIPALFSAMAAGLLVTRTTDDESEKERDLGPAIARQIGSKPHVLMVAGGLALAMGLIPGFPTLVFAILGLAMMGAGAFAHPAMGGWLRSKINPKGAEEAQEQLKEVEVATSALAPVTPLLLQMRPPTGVSIQTISDAVAPRIDSLQTASGVKIPQIRIALDPNETAPFGTWALTAYDAPIGNGVLEVSAADYPLHIAAYTEELLRRNIGIFLGLQEVTDSLNQLGDAYPEVVKEAVRAVSTSRIAEVLRLLAEEGVPLRNMRDPVEAISEIGQYEREAGPMAERVRVAMRRHLIAPLCVNGRLPVLMVGSELEDIIRQTLTPVDGQMRLAINPQQMRALIGLLAEQVQATGARAILTAQDLRRPLRLLIAADLFHTAVISFNELNPAVPLDVVGELNRAPDSLANTAEKEYAE